MVDHLLLKQVAAGVLKVSVLLVSVIVLCSLLAVLSLAG
jgi:hypothetical protein